MNNTSPFSRFQTPLRPAWRRLIISHNKLDQSPHPTRLLMVASLAVVVLFAMAVPVSYTHLTLPTIYSV